MLKLDQNSDFKRIETFKVQSKYYDFDPYWTHKEYWDWQALDTYIENVIMTMPGERIFNLGFGSPLFSIIFENANDDIVQSLYESTLNLIESYVPVKLNKSKCKLDIDGQNHVATILINYDSNDGMIKDHTFARRIRK